MKIKLTSIILLCLMVNLSQGQDTRKLKESDYQRAQAMLRGNVDKFVDNNIRPQWTRDGRVWYEAEAEGQSIYKLVDPNRKKILSATSRKELFEKGKVEQEAERRFRRTSISPDGKYEAFIRDWNLWIREVETGEGKSPDHGWDREFWVCHR